MNDARHHVTAAWVQLLSTPPYLSLQSVGESDEPLLLSAELTALLPRLPSLTALCVAVADSSCLAGVSRVSTLRSLEVRIGELPDPAQDGMVRLARAIRACHGLRKLALAAGPDVRDTDGMMMSSPLLASCLAGLPELHTLQLTDMKISSLAFLSRGSLPRTLTRLSLESLNPRMLPEELVHVFQLKALQHLTLRSVCSEAIPEQTQRQLRPPSTKLLALRRSYISAASEEVRYWLRAYVGMPLLAEEKYRNEP
jgi:hypothetical protein